MNKLAVPFKAEVPLNVAVPAEAVSDPLTVSAELIVKLLAVVMVPLTNTLLNEIVPLPLSVFDAPVNEIVPPDAVNEPVTVKFPSILMLLEVVLVPVETVRLAKLKPEPVMVLLVPLKVVVPPDS